MPHLRIETNVAKANVPDGLAKELCSLIAQLLGKPEGYCCVTIVPDQIMVFGGTDEPCGQCVLMSIGQIGRKENIVTSKALFEKLKTSLGIPPTRMYIAFRDESGENIGYNGKTFA